MSDNTAENQQGNTPNVANIDEMEYRVPAPMFAQMVSLISELPGKHSWQILAAASQMRPEKKR